ncbi:MAG: pentapeptide repeat-containing protein [Cyanobacteria bacterium J06648_16]
MSKNNNGSENNETENNRPNPSPSSPKTPQKDLADEDVEKLRREFDALLSIKDTLKRDYRLIQQAKASDIDTDLYKNLFTTYKEQKHHFLGPMLPILRRSGAFLGQLAIFSGLFLFITEADQREDATHNEAWQILNDVKPGETSSAGRIGALETLTAGCASQAIDSGPHPIRDVVGFLRDLPFVDGFFPDCVSLQGLDVQGAHLPNINLVGATLRDARLQKTGLWEAKLSGADLERAQMMRSQLSGATLTQANLARAQLQGAALPNTNLTSANLTHAHLGCVTVSNSESSPFLAAQSVEGAPTEVCASLVGATLTEANLTAAVLSAANLSTANLQGADLRQADLNKANLAGANLAGADLTGADLSETNLRVVNFDNALLLSADLQTERGPVVKQLTGDNPPWLCNTQLKLDKQIDGNRDCDIIPAELRARYPTEFETLEDAEAFVAEQTR